MDADKLVNWLLEQEPDQVLQWLYEAEEGTHPLPGGFAWRGLAECAASNAFSTSAFPNLDWANVAGFVYNRIIAEEKGSKRLIDDLDKKKMSYFSLELALMRLRVGCISHFGHMKGDLVLDVDQLVKDFLGGLIFSRDEAREKGTQKRNERSLKDHMELVSIQERLKILRPLEEKHLLPENPELKAWFFI